MIDATPLLRAAAARRLAALARMDGLQAQRATLARLLRRAARTLGASVADYAAGPGFLTAAQARGGASWAGGTRCPG